MAVESSVESDRVIRLTVLRHQGTRGRVVVSWHAAATVDVSSVAIQPNNGTVSRLVLLCCVIYTHPRRVFYFYFYEILVDSMLVTCRIGEQKISCLLQSPPTIWRQRRWNLFVFLYKFSTDMNDIVVVFYFYSHRNKSKRHASCFDYEHYR